MGKGQSGPTTGLCGTPSSEAHSGRFCPRPLLESDGERAPINGAKNQNDRAQAYQGGCWFFAETANPFLKSGKKMLSLQLQRQLGWDSGSPPACVPKRPRSFSHFLMVCPHTCRPDKPVSKQDGCNSQRSHIYAFASKLPSAGQEFSI